MSLMDVLNGAERWIGLTAERRRLATRSKRAESLTSLDQLRGIGCHCPPGLAFHHVHSEAIREAADVVIDYDSNVEHPLRPQVPLPFLVKFAPAIPRGAVVHVKADHVAAFAATMLPRLSAPVVLVTGDADRAQVARHRHLLDHPMIGHWFAQNADLDADHPRLSPIPIGLDNPVYTKFEKRLGFLVDMLAGRARLDPRFSRNDTGDQRRFNAAAAVARGAIGRKPLAVLCTFHKNHRIAPDISGLPDRVAAAAALGGRPFSHFVTRRIPQDECWRMHASFAFEASPQGNGMDCFRTWEALALGTVPIVRRSPLDRLYRAHRLPVAIVEDWEEVTPARLAQWAEELVPALEPARHKLSAGYWTGLIRARSVQVAAGA
ncbi:MAG: hypothetical protein U1E16_05685 [Hyphomicrobiales bacterium]